MRTPNPNGGIKWCVIVHHDEVDQMPRLDHFEVSFEYHAILHYSLQIDIELGIFLIETPHLHSLTHLPIIMHTYISYMCIDGIQLLVKQVEWMSYQ
jgi:hypothetical protein